MQNTLHDFDKTIIAFSRQEVSLAQLQHAAEAQVNREPEQRTAVLSTLQAAHTAGQLSTNQLTKLVGVVEQTIINNNAQVDITIQTIIVADQQTVVMGDRHRPTASVSSDQTVVAGSEATNTPDPIESITSDNLSIGDTLEGRYEILDVLGQGGMGKIFLAKDLLKYRSNNPNYQIALKVLSQSFRDHPDAKYQLEKEGAFAQGMSHPNIVSVFEYYDSGFHAYITMEYLKGEDLASFMDREAKMGLSLNEAWPIIRGACLALMHAHDNGIVHSDFKPSNVWITEEKQIKVLDFGIARPVDPTENSGWNAGKLGGYTLRYASCETLEFATPDPRDDIYCLACVAYELLTGKHPFGDKGYSLKAERETLVPTRPPKLARRHWNVLRAGLALRRPDRISTVSDFLNGLDPYKKNHRFWPIAATSIVLVAGIAFYFLLGQGALSETQKYKDALLSHPITDQRVTKATSESYLEEASLYLEDGTAALQKGNLKLGSSDLLNGTSTAFDAFFAILKSSTDEASRQHAIQGIIEINQTFVATIEKLIAANEDQRALWLTCQAMSRSNAGEIPMWPDLLGLYEVLWASQPKLEPGLAPIRGCKPQYVKEEWGEEITLRSPRR